MVFQQVGKNLAEYYLPQFTTKPELEAFDAEYADLMVNYMDQEDFQYHMAQIKQSQGESKKIHPRTVNEDKNEDNTLAQILPHGEDGEEKNIPSH